MYEVDEGAETWTTHGFSMFVSGPVGIRGVSSCYWHCTNGINEAVELHFFQMSSADGSQPISVRKTWTREKSAAF